MKRVKTRGRTRSAPARGQTTVEYIMLMGAAAFFVVALKKLVVEGIFIQTLPDTVNAVQTEASTGGQAEGYYYLNSASVGQ